MAKTEKKNKKEDTLEKLFPTVMKIRSRKHESEESKNEEEEIPVIETEEEETQAEEDDDDNETEVLASTESEILINPIFKIMPEMAEIMSEEEKYREQCRLNNMRKVVLDGISNKKTKPAEREKLVKKLTIIDANMNTIIRSKHNTDTEH